jgi:hypothetical protein
VLTLARSLISKRGNPYRTTRSPWVSDFDSVQIDGAAELAAHIERFPSAETESPPRHPPP